VAEIREGPSALESEVQRLLPEIHAAANQEDVQPAGALAETLPTRVVTTPPGNWTDTARAAVRALFADKGEMELYTYRDHIHAIAGLDGEPVAFGSGLTTDMACRHLVEALSRDDCRPTTNEVALFLNAKPWHVRRLVRKGQLQTAQADTTRARKHYDAHRVWDYASGSFDGVEKPTPIPVMGDG
jgi:hypothetical protein